MDWTNATTGYLVDTTNYWEDYLIDAGEEMSLLENDEYADAADLNGFGDSSNLKPVGGGTDVTVLFHPLSSMEVEVLAPVVASRTTPQQILEDITREAHFPKTDGIDDASWASIREKLANMSFGEFRGVWQPIANVIAVDCFSPDGNIDLGKTKDWMDFLGKSEIFKEEPLCFIPHVEFVRSQICVVLECLYNNRNGARDKLDAASHNPVSSYGQSIIDIIFPGVVSPFNPAVAIVASLCTPHRQADIPTCSVDSLINEEIRNHPERLIEIYAQMLGGGDQIAFPSGYIVKLQPIIDGFITVDLKNGGIRRDDVFEDIMSGDSAKITKQKKHGSGQG